MRQVRALDIHSVLIVLAGVSLVTSLTLHFQATAIDFVTFYDSGHAWNTGQPLFTGTGGNLNPPSAVVALFAPLAHLPLSIARAVWFVLSMTAFATAFALTARELRWSRERTACAFAAFAVTYPAWLAWYQGQTVWLLSLPATISWRAYRQGRLTAAGVWLAPVIAMKPPLALAAIMLPLGVCLAAGVSSAALSLLIMAWTGMGPWLAWWHFRDDVFWITWVDNLSLWGQLGRLTLHDVWQVRLSHLPGWAPALMTALGLLMYVRLRRESDPDRRMAMAWLTGTLLSPLGWVYYLVVGLGPFLASYRANLRAPLMLFCVPAFLTFYPVSRGPMGWVVGSIYTVAAVWAVVVYASAPDGVETDDHERQLQIGRAAQRLYRRP